MGEDDIAYNLEWQNTALYAFTTRTRLAGTALPPTIPWAQEQRRTFDIAATSSYHRWTALGRFPVPMVVVSPCRALLNLGTLGGGNHLIQQPDDCSARRRDHTIVSGHACGVPHPGGGLPRLPYRPFRGQEDPEQLRYSLHLQTALTVCRCAKLVGAFHATGPPLRT